MMKQTLRLVLMYSLLLLVACSGGGGGDDGGEAPPSTPPPTGGDGGGSDEETDVEGSAVISFPVTDSQATAGQITIRGIVADENGIADVLINGVSILGAASAPERSLKMGSNASNVTPLDEDETTASFSTSVDLEAGDNTVEVSVVDKEGNTVEAAASTQISFVHVPTVFTLDADNNRIVGASLNLLDGDTSFSLVDYDYAATTQTVYTQEIGSHIASCFKPDAEDFLYIEFAEGNTLILHRYNLVTDTDEEVGSTTLTPVADGFADAVFTGNLVCRSGEDVAYYLFNYSDAGGGGFARSTVLEWDLGTGAATVLVETDTGEAEPWIAVEIALWGDAIVTQSGLNFSRPMQRIDRDTGALSEVAPSIDVADFALAPATETLIYVATFDGIDEIDVVAETRVNISEVDASNPLVFSQVIQAAFDAGNERILVGDSDLNAIIAVDAGTGERTEFLSRRRGEGTKLIAPRRLAVTSDGTLAYIADDGSNAPERLFEVDLETGDRREIGDISRPGELIWGLALDETSRNVYVLFSKEVLEVDLDSELVTTIASSAVGSGPLLSSGTDLILDVDNGRLLITDAGEEAIFSLDLDTHERTILSQIDVRGAGDTFANVNSVSLDGEAGALYVSNQLSANVMKVDLETGDREIVLDQCIQDDNNVLGIDETLTQVLHDPATETLLIFGDNVLRFDIGQAQCSVVQSFAPLLLWRAHAPDQSLFGLVFGAFVQYDPASGEQVILSQ